MKYKIFIKYTSTFKKDFYEVYKVKSEDGQEVEFETTDIEELNKAIEALDEQIGHDSIRVVADLTYEVNIMVDKDSMYQPTTSEEMIDVYSNAYQQVFGNGGE
nr:MAG TPA: Head-to-tail joining protein W (GpW), fast protein folding, downhill [Caudoviricetes sp.]